MTTTKEKPDTDTVPDNATADMEAAVNSALDKFEKDNGPDGDKFAAASTKKDDAIDLSDDELDTDEPDELDTKTDLPSDKDDDDEPKDDVSPKADEEDDDEPEPVIDSGNEIDDDLLESAVKAGLSMKNARKFPDAESLREAIGLLSGNTDTPADTDPAKEETSEVDSVLADIPDLDPEEYDDAIVKGFSALKKLVESQSNEIQSLKDGKTGTWIEQQINTLGDVAKTVRDDPNKKSALLKKYEILKSGYKAAGESATEEAIFQEAASMVLGDDMRKQTEKAKAKAARKRNKARISRVSGQSAQTPGGDDVEDIVNIVSEKFNIPK